jgi:hypothetical protein
MGASGGVQTVTDVVIDSADIGVQLSGDSSFIARSILTRVNTGIQPVARIPAPGRGPSVITGNNITCNLSEVGISFSEVGKPYLIAADTINGCGNGIILSGMGSGTRVAGGAIRNSPNGIVITQDTSTVFVDSTGISGSVTGMLLNNGRLVATRNRIESNTRYGVQVVSSAYGVPQIHLNSFVGNATAVFATDTVDASANWWGAPAGACTTGADCVSGRISVDNPLGAPPTDLPGLVKPFQPVVAVRLAAPAAPVAAVPTTGTTSVQLAARMAAVNALRLERHRSFEAARRRHQAEIQARVARLNARAASKLPAVKLAPR